MREGDKTVEREDKRGGKRSSLHPLAFTALYRRGYRFRGTNSEKRSLLRVFGAFDRNKGITVNSNASNRLTSR